MVATKKMHPDARAQTRALIDKMLTERKEMLVLFYRVTELAPFSAEKPVKPALDEFCQILVDYIASAHFGLYHRIVEGTERRRAVLDVAKDIYTEIAATTQIAVAFNEKYQRLSSKHYPKALRDDISTLGEALATRVELEDRLIAAMLGDKAAPTQRAASTH
jgi:regulator of sigma D